jgi:hypothetical protein
MARNNRFAKGSGAYTCSNCGKKTRSTGRGDNEHVGLCADCYDCGGDENAVADGTMTQADFDAAWPVGHPSRSDTGRTAKEEPEPAPVLDTVLLFRVCVELQARYLKVGSAPLEVHDIRDGLRFGSPTKDVYFKVRELPETDFFGAAFHNVSASAIVHQPKDGLVPVRLSLNWTMRELGTNGTTRDLWFRIADGAVMTREQLRAEADEA